MVWKHLKKPAILVASLALAVGIAPMVAFADDATPEGADGGNMVTQDDGFTSVDVVNLQVQVPVAGESSSTPPKATSNDVGYTILNNENHWVNDNAELLGDVTFVEGDTYNMIIRLKPNDGITFGGGNMRNVTYNVTGGTFKDVYEGDWTNGSIDVLISAAAAKANGGNEPADAGDTPETQDPSATEPEKPEPSVTDPAETESTPEAAVTTDNTPATETSTATQATTSSTNTTASTLPKTADTLPVALFGAMALMSALVLAAAWRFRRN